MLRELRDFFVIKKDKSFDPVYYLLTYPDVRRADINPLFHFVRMGWKEGRNPNANFDTKFYLENNSDIKNAGINPYYHYIKYGKKEARVTSSRLLINNNHTNALDYMKWLKLYEEQNTYSLEEIEEEIQKFEVKPLISILVPCYDSNLEWLTQAIESVRNQTYPYWELCLADDCSPNQEVRNLLINYKKIDGRIKTVFRNKNGNISAATNSALEISSGNFIALLDHDDLLHKDALFWVSKVINEHPNVCLIYSDEDKINQFGDRYDPYFKSDFNYDLFLSQNIISHLGVYKKEIVKQVGCFREGYEGSQDWDLALRVVEKIYQEEIKHIHRILYHWRAHSDSTAEVGDNKPYALIAGMNAVRDHLKRKNVPAKVELIQEWRFVKVIYELPKTPPLVSLIIPTKNKLQLLKNTVSSIQQKTDYASYEILIINNNSDEPECLAYLNQLSMKKNIRVINDTSPFNYSKINNNAVLNYAKGQIIGLINNDIEVITPNWLSEMVSLVLQPGVGAVGARLWYPDNTLQHGGVILGLGGVAGHFHRFISKKDPGYFGRAVLRQTLSAVTGACLLLKKEIFEKVGGLEEDHLAVAFGDIDFCLRISEMGYRNVWTPFAELFHLESASRGNDMSEENYARFLGEIEYMQETWGDSLKTDPYYNPNLSLAVDNFGYSFPPRISAEEF